MIWIALILLSAVLSLIIGLYSLLSLKTPGVRYFSLATFCEAAWSFLLVLEILATDLLAKLSLDIIQSFIMSFIPVFGLFFVLVFSKKRVPHPFLSFILLISLPFLCVVYFFFDAAFGDLFSRMGLVESAGFIGLYYPYRWYHFLLFSSLGLILISTIFIYVNSFIRLRNRETYKHLFIVLGLIIPMLNIVFSISGIQLGPFRDSSPFYFAIGNIFILIGLLKYRVFGLITTVRNQVFERAEVGLAVCDKKFNILDFNTSFIKDFGDASSLTLTDIIPVGGELSDLMSDKNAQAREFIREIEIAGEKRWFNIILRKLGRPGYTPRGLSVSSKNITEAIQQKELMKERQTALIETNRELNETLDRLQKAQTQLISAEKMAALGQLMAGIAHELNTPIGAIQSSRETLDRSVTDLLQGYGNRLKNLAWEDVDRVQALVMASHGSTVPSDFKEIRRVKKALLARYESAVMASPGRTVSLIIDAGLHDQAEMLDFFLEKGILDDVLEYITSIHNIFQSIDIIEVGTRKVRKIVSALSSYSRKNSDSLQNVDINQSIDTVLTLFHDNVKRGLVITTDFRCDRLVSGNENDLGQVWINLLQNAVHATGGKGRISIETDCGDDWIEARFTDNGSGIPSAIQGRIFEPFFTSKPAGMGTGLGLDICRNIARRHRGDITCVSEPGRTVFTVILRGADPATS